MNIEKKILEIYEEINNSKKSLSDLQESALNAPLDKVSVNSPFGARWGTTHNGVDLAADAAEVKAPADGVVEVGEIKNDDCGGTVIINHADGFKTGFCHLQKIKVHAGQEVKQGDVIAISGGGANDPGHGRSDGRHLHFTLRKNGQLLNPMDYINKDGIIMTGESPKSSSSSDTKDTQDTSSEDTKTDDIIYKMAKKLGDMFLGSKEKSEVKTEGKEIFKTANSLNEMIQTKKEFKKFLMNEAPQTSGELFGGDKVVIPANGAHAGQSGWQSNNAWDIMGAVGTPVYAIADGVAQTFSDYGPKVIEKNGKRLFGQSFTVKSEGGLPSVYYTHLKESPVKQGSKIECGQLIGYIMDFPGSESDHVHIGVESGHDIKEFLNDDGSLKCSGTSGSSSKSSSSSDTKDTQDTSSEDTKTDDIIYKMAKKLGDMFLGSKEKSEVKTEGKEIFKTANSLNEMIQTKKEFKKFLMNEAPQTSGELFGGDKVVIPANGAHAGQSGWQSNNAWDIMGAVGTPVYAIADGVAQTFSDYGPKVIEKNGKRLFGQSFTVKSEGGLPSVYYTHLKESPVKQGSKIECGQLIGYIMDFPGSESDHVHIGVESGHDIKEFLNDDGSLKCSGTSGSSSKSSSSSDTQDTQDTSSEDTKPDDIIYKMAKKLGDMFLGSKENDKAKNESLQIEEQRNFGNDVQNRYGRLIIPGDKNSKIKSPISGVVDNSRYSSSCNNQIIIRAEHIENLYLQFCGISKPLVNNGMEVSEGQVIGTTESDVEVSLYDSSWNAIPIRDDFGTRKPRQREKDEQKPKQNYKERHKGKHKEKHPGSDKDRQKNKGEERYDDAAVALIASLPSMAFDTVFGNRYDKKTGELKQKRWGGVADKRPVDPWVIDAIKKPFTKKVNEDIEKIKRLLK